MANPADFLALFGEDEGAAQAQAQALAEAMGRRRAAGTVASIIGGPFARAGQAFLGDAGQTEQELMRVGALRNRGQATPAAPKWVGVPEAGYAYDTRDPSKQVAIPKLVRTVRQPAPKEVKPPDTSKMNLGEYLTPATSNMTDQQRNELMNNLAVPGAQLLDQLSELEAVIDTAGSVPSVEQLNDIQRLTASILVKSNKVAGLGALSGPDLELLTKASGSAGKLTNWFGEATGLRDLKGSVRRSAERWATDISKAAGAYGATPVPGKPLDFGGYDARVAEYRKKWGGTKSAPAGSGGVKMTLGGKTKVVPPDQVEFWRAKGATEVP